MKGFVFGPGLLAGNAFLFALDVVIFRFGGVAAVLDRADDLVVRDGLIALGISSVESSFSKAGAR